MTTSTTCGQLCLGNVRQSVKNPHMVSFPPGVSAWTATASGGETVYLVDTANNLWACGDDEKGQLGTTNTPPPTESDAFFQLPYTSVDQISSTNFNSAVLTG